MSNVVIFAIAASVGVTAVLWRQNRLGFSARLARPNSPKATSLGTSRQTNVGELLHSRSSRACGSRSRKRCSVRDAGSCVEAVQGSGSTSAPYAQEAPLITHVAYQRCQNRVGRRVCARQPRVWPRQPVHSARQQHEPRVQLRL